MSFFLLFFKCYKSDELNINSVVRIHMVEERVQAVNRVACNTHGNTSGATIILNNLCNNDGLEKAVCAPV